MSRASGEFFQAVDGLRQAVEREFIGNDYYLVANQVTELGEILCDKTAAPQADGMQVNFALALDAVRKRTETELFDNRSYIVAHKLDVLSFLGRRFYGHTHGGNGAIGQSKARASLSSHASADGRVNGAAVGNFEGLAAAAKARTLNANGLGTPEMHANGEVEGEAPAHVPDPSSIRQPWTRWSPPAFLSKPFRRSSPPAYRRIWDHRPLKSVFVAPPASSAPVRPKKKPPRERFILPRQRMIPRPLQPAKR
jgi:hypothetical protein